MRNSTQKHKANKLRGDFFKIARNMPEVGDLLMTKFVLREIEKDQIDGYNNNVVKGYLHASSIVVLLSISYCPISRKEHVIPKFLLTLLHKNRVIHVKVSSPRGSFVILAQAPEASESR